MVVQVINHKNPDLTNKQIAGFDFDWTLVCPKGPTTWCCNRYDWKFLYTNCKEILQGYHNIGMTIVIVTYQSRAYKIEMLNDFLEQFNFPICLIISDSDTQKDFNLKDFLRLGENEEIDQLTSFYCGDADGEKGSWSDMDYKFAMKNNIQFFKPQEIFRTKSNIKIEFGSDTDFEILKNYDVIIMCGSPGSGKSTFVKQQIEPNGFTILSSDEYKSNKTKMAKVLKSMISNKQKIVIDACNPTLENRNYWINIIKDASYVVVYIDIEKSVALERNNKRDAKISQIAIHTWFKRFEDTEIDIIVNNSREQLETQLEQLSIM